MSWCNCQLVPGHLSHILVLQEMESWNMETRLCIAQLLVDKVANQPKPRISCPATFLRLGDVIT